MQYVTGLGLTPEEKARFEADARARKQAKDCQKCYEFRDWALQYSPTVVFMMQQIKKLGEEVSDSQIICDVCDDYKGGGFHPDLGILLCQNRILDKYHLEDTLSHELVHYYDNTKFQVDWLNLRHHACSEIRASSLSGECRMMTQLRGRGFMTIGKGHQECVRRRAILSVKENPHCKDAEHAAKVVDEVFDSCFNDTRPFDEIYR